jgi:hypothetical protein
VQARNFRHARRLPVNLRPKFLACPRLDDARRAGFAGA